ncbi:hypothetical protein F4824DRAFT_497255 [Ustulina deusta]|nr:hypothetical protein F4824DRAFT_497255 [Ustulina deusta]
MASKGAKFHWLMRYLEAAWGTFIRRQFPVPNYVRPKPIPQTLFYRDRGKHSRQSDRRELFKATNTILGRDIISDDGYLMSFPKYVHSALSAGPGLDAMNRRSIQVITKSLNMRAQRGTTTLNMFSWRGFTDQKPLRDPAMEEVWYIFEPGMMTFVLNLFPRLFARKSFKAREYMVKVWERYFDERSYEQGSELIKARVKINDDFQIPLRETARIEIGGSLAILTNTLPGTFWVTYSVGSTGRLQRQRQRVSSM